MRARNIFQSFFVVGGALFLFTGCPASSNCDALGEEVADCLGMTYVSPDEEWTDEEEAQCATALAAYECDGDSGSWGDTDDTDDSG